MDDEYERVLLIKPDVFIYRIPPRTTNRAYRAADWKLDEPDWVGKLKLVAKGDDCVLKLEDKNTGQLFAKCPVDKYPGAAIESVSDSSRYFVIRIQDDDNKRSAFIGIGFSDRGDSFDLNVALQDHFKGTQKTETNESEEQESVPKLDLKLKEGQTIKVNLNLTKKPGSATSRQRTKPTGGSGAIGILPPPPGGIKIPPPSKSTANVISNSEPSNDLESVGNKSKTNTSNDLLLDFDSLSVSRSTEQSSNCPKNSASQELWNDFEGSTNTAAASKQTSDWANF